MSNTKSDRLNTIAGLFGLITVLSGIGPLCVGLLRVLQRIQKVDGRWIVIGSDLKIPSLISSAAGVLDTSLVVVAIVAVLMAHHARHLENKGDLPIPSGVFRLALAAFLLFDLIIFNFFEVMGTWPDFLLVTSGVLRIKLGLSLWAPIEHQEQPGDLAHTLGRAFGQLIATVLSLPPVTRELTSRYVHRTMEQAFVMDTPAINAWSHNERARVCRKLRCAQGVETLSLADRRAFLPAVRPTGCVAIRLEREDERTINLLEQAINAASDPRDRRTKPNLLRYEAHDQDTMLLVFPRKTLTLLQGILHINNPTKAEEQEAPQRGAA